jgi:hypothetical protein
VKEADNKPWRLFRTRRKRPRAGAAEQRDEIASSHARLQQGFTTGGMGSARHFARQQSSGPNVRFGSKADIGARPRNVRFVPKADIWRRSRNHLFDHIVGAQ